MVADSATTYAGLASGLSELNPVMNPITMPVVKYGMKKVMLARSPQECVRGLTGFTGMQTAAAGWNIGMIVAGGPLGAITMSIAVAIANRYWRNSAITECLGGLTESIVEVTVDDPRPIIPGTRVVGGYKLIQPVTATTESLSGTILAQQPADSSEVIITLDAERILPYIPSPRWIEGEYRELTAEDISSGRQQIIKASGDYWK